jgi:hypothetical protein
MANQDRARLAPISESVVIGKQGRLLYQQSSIYETFTYNLLDTSADCIRLVILEPSATAGGVLRCCLVHVTFGEIPKYEALSYTWGSEALKNAIVIDGKSFLIGDNFWEALVGLQRPAEGRVLCINAIYVNQADISGRNQQLRIMPHIYRRAEMVLVWLGPANESREGMRNLDDYISPFAEGKKGMNFIQYLFEMCTIDYWNRVWIIQEIASADEPVGGKKEASNKMFGSHRLTDLLFCPALLLGKIVWVGPTYKEELSKLQKVDVWTASIKDHVEERDLLSSYGENDYFAASRRFG